MLPLPEGASYLGFIFARANSAEAGRIGACANRTPGLEFQFSAALPVVR